MKPFETKDRMAEISKRWKELDDAEKAVYNAKATQVINISSNHNSSNVAIFYLALCS